MVSVTRSVVSSLFWLAVTLALGCNSAHTNDSTETGNPPFLDVDEISLVISAGEVRIVGAAGAVTPGGAGVELENVGTGEVTRGMASADGSFDIAIDATEEAVIEVRASSGGMRSGSVYVTRGGAMVGTGEGDALSCMQRSNFASQALGSVLSGADPSCRTVADCKLVPYKTVCTDTCGDAIVASSEEGRIRAAVEAIDEGLCASFAADGCQVIALPCVPPPTGPVACVEGRCQQQDASMTMTPVEPTCPSCLDQEVRWGLSNNQVEYAVSDCDMFWREPEGQLACGSQLPHCDSGRPGPTVEALLTALANPDVERALQTGETVGGPPTPGGFALNVQVGDRSFLISNCGTGPNCESVPAGVRALKAILDRIANEIECTPSTCPPNAVPTEVCTECGLAGGCGKREMKCALVCSDDSPCASQPGTSCSSRNVCELVSCI